MKCPKCDGLGAVSEVTDKLGNVLHITTIFVCSDCNGKGTIKEIKHANHKPN